jgi:hypothetical protein
MRTEFKLPGRVVRTALMAGAVLGAVVTTAAPANAAIFIALQESGVNSNTKHQVASGTTFATFGGAYGSFTLNAISGVETPLPHLLDTNSIDVSGAKTGTLNVFITETGLTFPTGHQVLKSSFTENTITGNETITERTFLDPNNGKFTTTIPLGSKVFNTIGTNVQFTPVNLTGTYSITTEYTIVSLGRGSSNSTINISAIPEASTWAMLLVGFGGLGAVLRSSRRRRAFAVA